MTLKQKIYIAAGAALIMIMGIAAGSITSHFKIKGLEDRVESAKDAAAAKERQADEKSAEAAAFKEKIEYMERNLSEIRSIARKQNDELEKLNVNSAAARGSVERARSVRTIAATADELCGKLAELGHPCGE